MRILSLLLLFLSLMTTARAQERYTQLALHAEDHTPAAGDTVTLALEQRIAPGWHTYWRNPGDSGAEPFINWTLPEGFTIGEIQWPAPTKIPYGPLLNYGYKDRAILLQDLNVPDSYDGAPVTLTADVDILVCADVCIPETETLSITLGEGSSSLDFTEARKALPETIHWRAEYYEENGHFLVNINFAPDYQLRDLAIFPAQWGIVDNAAPVEWMAASSVLGVKQKRGDRALAEIDTLDFILKTTNDDGNRYYTMTAKPTLPLVFQFASSESPGTDSTSSNINVPLILLFAFLGGLILNLMPCVFPVLSIKAFSLIKVANESTARAKAHGISYMAGVMVSFVAIAAILIGLQAGGAQIGWGFQLQNPIVVTFLIYLLLCVGLNLSGVFGFKPVTAGDAMAGKQGLSGSFFTGVLATLVATPCTAPFMATAIGVALTLPAPAALGIFAMLGFGLAFPYMLLAFAPSLQAQLPKPGAWMKTFQHVLAFPMFAAATWLITVLAEQVNHTQLSAVLYGLVALSFGVWLFAHNNGALTRTIALIAIIAAFAAPFLSAPKADLGTDFSPAALEEALQTENPVFVEMTAAWCITCKVNHAVALDVTQTRDLFAKEKVEYLVGDWTSFDPHITDYLKQFNRSGVPIYVFYPAPKNGERPKPELLPQILTPDIVENAITAH